MLRLIRDCKPKWVIAENVYGLTTLQDGLVFEEVLSGLEATGYEVQPFVIPAIATDAPHRRDRVWIVANAKSKRPSEVDEGQQERRTNEYTQGFDAFWRLCASLPMVMEPDFTKPSSGVRRNDDGLPEGMDRLKALGNAIVPQVAMQIMSAIRSSES
jgi:DNA (cytosine-5)-methyltransferase 1